MSVFPMSYKKQIVNYLNSRDSEDYQVLDVFQRNTDKHGGLHPFGFKLLKNEYTFYEVPIKFGKSIREYSYLTRHTKGLYYLGAVKSNSATFHTTDKYVANVLKLSNGDFATFVEMVNRKKQC